MAGITVSGVDERTPLPYLRALAAQGTELGILYTFDPEWRLRYPSLEWIKNTVAALPDKACALHVCGQRARRAMLAGVLDTILPRVKRVQINGLVSEQSLYALRGYLQTKELITQHTPANAALVGVAIPAHQLLVDSSGGAGLLPTTWERPDTIKPVGFAGGLGLDNLRQELPHIIAACRDAHFDATWIDMESSLRNPEDDRFDAIKAVQVSALFRSLLGQKKPWPRDAVMILASFWGEENKATMEAIVEAACRDCGSKLASDSKSIRWARSLAAPHKQWVAHFCLPCQAFYNHKDLANWPRPPAINN